MKKYLSAAILTIISTVALAQAPHQKGINTVNNSMPSRISMNYRCQANTKHQFWRKGKCWVKRRRFGGGKRRGDNNSSRTEPNGSRTQNLYCRPQILICSAFRQKNHLLTQVAFCLCINIHLTSSSACINPVPVVLLLT